MATLQEGWIAFEAKEGSIKSRALTGGLPQRTSPIVQLHLGQFHDGQTTILTPHHSRGRKTYALHEVTRIDVVGWRNMAACPECHRLLPQLLAA
jgi:hypothetical protein